MTGFFSYDFELNFCHYLNRFVSLKTVIQKGLTTVSFIS